ncbi:MAM and LDL-receptor class A domain-containing protein 2 [Ixodes scapularis]|uniref:MAM and LDL-receptor class A domain-containing protein 2 n=1 Tax=Ixodes scapularis TaxID=6945 RepID=UPI001A9CF691|nr:MAM and LDL-receptor class A domain-containing protein 2 [Ixodes scapularis]
MAHKQSSSHKRARSAFLVAIVLLQCAAYVTSDTCDFENGMCKGYTTSGSGSGVFKVARVKDLNFGPNVDHRPGTESGSIAYATGKGSAILRRSFQAPFCFTGWYHVSGVKRPHLFFHVSSQGNYRAFHFLSEPFVGFWYKVVYSEKWTGLANVSIVSVLHPASEASFITLDDLMFEPGPCPPGPQEGSCDFDWGDTCGYSVGNGSGLWQLNHWKASDSGIGWTINEDVTVGHGGGFAIFKPSSGTNPVGLLSSPKVKGHTGRQCLQFYYYVSQGRTNNIPHGLRVFVTGHDGSRLPIWGLSGDALFHERWSPAQASFDGGPTIQLDFVCSLGSGQPHGFYCGLDYVRLSDCSRPQGSDNHDCNFEEGLCSWMNLRYDYVDSGIWTLAGGTTKTTVPKPSKDHTLGTSAGSYVFYSSFQQIKGAKAQLVSEAVVSAGLATNCMEFQYIVAGGKDAKLLVKSTSLFKNINYDKNQDVIWEAGGGEFDTWLLGRIALSEKTRVIFEAVTGTERGYIALDDIRIYANDSCETFPKPSPQNTPVDELLNCDFGDWTLCKWAFNPTDGSVAWRFGNRYSPETSIGPTALPAGTKGTFIFATGAMIAKNHGPLLLTSPKVPRQTQPVCATFRYHLFGALGTVMRVSLMNEDKAEEGHRRVVYQSFIFHAGRTTVDRWFTVQRNLNMNAEFNTIKLMIGSNGNKASEMAIGPVEFASGACQFLTDSLGWCDFEYDTCDWTLEGTSNGWRRNSNLLRGYNSHTRSGPPDSNAFLELRAYKEGNGSTVTSPWFQGRLEPQCLKFWYKRDKPNLGKIVVELAVSGAKESSVIWEQPPYPQDDWMLARVPIVSQEKLKVVFRAIIMSSKDHTLDTLGIDDVQLDPEPCKPLYECDFAEDFCGYVNGFTLGGLQWLVGTGRVAKPELPPRVPPYPSPSVEYSKYDPKSWERFAYVDLTVSTGALPSGAEKADLASPVFAVGDKGDTFRLWYFRRGPDIVSMELRQISYKDSGAMDTLQTVNLPEGGDWQSTVLKLKPSKQSQIVVAVTRGKGTNGIAAVGLISAEKTKQIPDEEATLWCNFEDGTFCGWEHVNGDISFKLNEPSKKIPPFPQSDHTLQAYRGRFIYAEASGSRYQAARLRSPELPADYRSRFCVSLWHTSAPNTYGYFGINNTVELYPQWRDFWNVRWVHGQHQMTMPGNADKFTLEVHISSGLIALDDLEVTSGKCPLIDKCTFELGSPCGFYWEHSSPRIWRVVQSKALKVPDHTLQANAGHFLYVNTTDVDPAHPESRVFLDTRDPTPSTCVTFWWKGFGTPSDLNVYVHTKETVLRDPVLSLYTRATPDGWIPRSVTISSKTKWQLVFEAVSPAYYSGESGVMVDDVEFSNGECPLDDFCSFEEDVCIPWVDVTPNSTQGNRGWQVQRAENFAQLSKDHTLQSGDGYYLLFKGTGDITNSAVLKLRERRFRCASFWFFISKSTSGCTIYAGDKVLRHPTKRWRLYFFNLSWGLKDGMTIRAFSGTDETAFVAIDDIEVDERECSELHLPATDDFVCKTSPVEKIPVDKVCDFVKDCSNGADELDCGNCVFENSTCGWDLGSAESRDLASWRRRRAGVIPGAPKLTYDGDTNGFYMIVALEKKPTQVAVRAVATSPVIRNTNFLCSLTFWYNYANDSFEMDLDLEVNGHDMTIWSLYSVTPKAPERTWNIAEAVLGRYTGAVKLRFREFQYPANDGYFAIDGLQYDNCDLPLPDPSPCEDNFKCENGVCISKYDVCNYVDHCGDGSDELNCGDHNLGCNFDYSFCDWKPVLPEKSETATSTWERIRPGTFLWLRPTRDHTSGHREGRFLILRPMNMMVESEIAGPILQANGTCAITFFYMIYKGAPSKLILGVRYAKGGPLTQIWSTSTPTYGFYFIERMIVFAEEDPFQVFFKGRHEATDGAAYIAIDDVSFSKGCRAYHGVLPGPPSTPAPTKPPTCPSDQFTCGTSETCIPANKVCDFKEDCMDGSDEKNCGACDFSIDLCGLTSADPDARYTWNRTSAQDVTKNPSSDVGLPKTDSNQDPQGFYCAYRETNQDDPQGLMNALLTPRFGEIAHPCTVSFYAFISKPPAWLWFGVQRSTKYGSVFRKRFALLKGSESSHAWTKMTAKVGNWNPGSRFYFITDGTHTSIDAIEYRGCHPDRSSDSYEEDLLVSCSFELEDKCGWFPENEVTELDWVKYTGGKPIRSWQPPSVDVGHSGPYMFIANHRNTEGRGHLVSKRLPASGGFGHCFSFWYSMRHPNSGTLNLLTRSEDNSTELLWSRSGPQGRSWLRGYADAFSTTYTKFVLEAVLPGSSPAVIAIDHIDVRGGECKSKTVCDFEYDFCDWKLHDWELSSGRSIPEPSIDHTTQTRSGSYVRLLRSNGHLVSPDMVVHPPSGSCLKFWYYLSGTDAEQLNVSRVTDSTREEPIWSVLASQVPQKTWLQGSANLLGHTGHLAAAFTGTTSGDPGTAVAVDDIHTDMKPCVPAGNCNFEEDFCNWRNIGPENHMRWYRNSGDTLTRGGPSSDHTLKTAEGIYLVLDAQDLSEVREGALESELLSYGPDVCFRMFYRIASGSDASVFLQIRDLSQTVLYKRGLSAPKTNEWTLFEQDVKSLPSLYTIRIFGSPGTGKKSDVAIDDIEVFSGPCSKGPLAPTDEPLTGASSSTQPSDVTFVIPTETDSPRDITTPGAASSARSTSPDEPSTVPAATCSSEEFDCRDNKNCIPLGLLCDGVQDCPNGLDEKCGGRNKCEKSLAFCPSGSPDWCINRDFLCDGHNDCSDGSDETLCGSCPSSFCLNGGQCKVWTDGGFPTCTCPDDVSGNRCEHVAGSTAEEQRYSTASNGWAIAVPVILILVGIAGVGYLYRKRRAVPSSALFVSNPTYDANTDQARILN